MKKYRTNKEFPANLSLAIVYRMFQEEPAKLKEFIDAYKASRSNRGQRPADKQDFAILAEYRTKKFSYQDLMRTFKMSEAKIKGAILRAARDVN